MSASADIEKLHNPHYVVTTNNYHLSALIITACGAIVKPKLMIPVLKITAG